MLSGMCNTPVSTGRVQTEALDLTRRAAGEGAGRSMEQEQLGTDARVELRMAAPGVTVPFSVQGHALILIHGELASRRREKLPLPHPRAVRVPRRTPTR